MSSTPWAVAIASIKCGAKKPGRSTATCEYPPDHLTNSPLHYYEDHHFGRTHGGYWKRWPQPKQKDAQQ